MFSVQLGAKPDLPTQNDYDGDGKTDVSVYRPQTGTFFVINSSGGVTARQFGQNGDYPVANYDTH
ncbi:MAG: peptidase M23, partial [Acidobacteriota bacterium]